MKMISFEVLKNPYEIGSTMKMIQIVEEMESKFTIHILYKDLYNNNKSSV